MILTILFFSVGLSMDAMAAAMAYGMRGIRIPLASKLMIGLCSLVYCALALWLGRAVSSAIPSQAGRWVGILLLAGLGVFSLVKSRAKKGNVETKEKAEQVEEGERTILSVAIRSLGVTIRVLRDPTLGDIDGSRVIDVKEALLLGLALSLDAIGAGAGAALSGMTSFALPLAAAVAQVLFLYAGGFLGREAIGRVPERALAFLPGCLLLAIAFLRLFS